MAQRDHTATRAVAALLVDVVDADGATPYVDAREANALAIVVAGSGAPAAALTVTLEHADADPGSAASYEAVPATQVRGEAVINTADQVAQLAYVGNKPYVRAVYSVTGEYEEAVSILAIGEDLARADHPGGSTLETGAVA